MEFAFLVDSGWICQIASVSRIQNYCISNIEYKTDQLHTTRLNHLTTTEGIVDKVQKTQQANDEIWKNESSGIYLTKKAQQKDDVK